MQGAIHRGSCLCGRVRFELGAAPREVLHCHCRMCQKAHGAAFATFARFAHEDLRFTVGEEAVATYRSSAEARRTFCAHCGSTLQFIRDGAPTFGLSVAALDTPLEPERVRECHTESKQDWLARTP